MDYEDFIWFIKEREKLRFQKEIGIPLQSSDPILSKTHFLNIHTKYDTGTIRLHRFIADLTDWEKLFYIFIYRTVYSTPRLMKDLTGIWFHDYRNIKLFKWKIHTDRQPYYFHVGKNSSLHQFLLTISLPVMKQFWTSFTEYKLEEIIDVEDVLSAFFALHTGRRMMKLLSSILVQDLAIQFPEKINPDSICRISIDAKQALKMLPGGRSDRKMERLLQSTGLNYSSLNRALGQWWQYLSRKKYYEEHDLFREEWLI